MDPNLFTVVGHGDTKPLVENDSADNRSMNRRVEIIINQGERDEKIISGEEALPEDDEFTEDLLKEAGLEGVEGFEILMDENEEGADEEAEGDSGLPEREISAFEPVPDDLLTPEEGAPTGDEFDDLTLDESGSGEGQGFDEPVPGQSELGQPELRQPEAEVLPTIEPDPVRNDFDLSVDPFSQPATESDTDSEFF